MKLLGISALAALVFGLAGCYTVVSHSTESEIAYDEPVYIEPIYIPIPVTVFECPLPSQYPMPVPNDSPEKTRKPESGDRDRNNSYSERDPLRNTGGRGTEERRNQGR